MGTKYASVTITGYNASPPSDDGTQDASNQLEWAKHKEKLGDPVKTGVESINTKLVTALDESVVGKADSYVITTAEHNKTVVVTTTSAGVNISLPDASTANGGFVTTVLNAANSTNSLTVDLNTSTDLLNNTTNGSLTLPIDASLTFIVNSGSNGYNIRQAHGVTVIGNALAIGGIGFNSDGVSIPDGTATKVPITHTVQDINSDFDTATNNRFDVPNDGVYTMTGAVRVQGGTTAMGCYIYVNGSIIAQDIKAGGTAGDGDSITATVSITKKLSSGDYVELYAGQSSGGALNTTIESNQTYLSVWRISSA